MGKNSNTREVINKRLTLGIMLGSDEHTVVNKETGPKYTTIELYNSKTRGRWVIAGCEFSVSILI